jgi:non-specific serine/threonine protein kinase
MLLGDIEKAKLDAEQSLSGIADFAFFRPGYAFILIYCNRLEEARAVVDAMPPQRSSNIMSEVCVFLQHALAGRRTEALATFSPERKAAARRVEWWSYYMADCHALVDETDEALDWVENAIRRGFINYPFLSQYDAILGKLHGHPRFQALMEKCRKAWENFDAS